MIAVLAAFSPIATLACTGQEAEQAVVDEISLEDGGALVTTVEKIGTARVGRVYNVFFSATQMDESGTELPIIGMAKVRRQGRNRCNVFEGPNSALVRPSTYEPEM